MVLSKKLKDVLTALAMQLTSDLSQASSAGKLTANGLFVWSDAMALLCAGIVYCFSRNECEKVAAELQDALRTEHGLNQGQRRAEVRHGPPFSSGLCRQAGAV